MTWHTQLGDKSLAVTAAATVTTAIATSLPHIASTFTILGQEQLLSFGGCQQLLGAAGDDGC